MPVIGVAITKKMSIQSHYVYKNQQDASCWFLLYGYITMHGQQNIKSVETTFWLESTSRNYTQQINWTLRTYFRQYQRESTNCL
jgi:hypothetical protein